MKPRLSLIGQAQQARHGEALQRAREQLALWRARHGMTASATVVPRATPLFTAAADADEASSTTLCNFDSDDLSFFRSA